MAIDTKAKRASVQAFLGYMLPPPDGAIAQGDRATVSWFYAGLDYTGVPFVPTTCPGWFSFHSALYENEFRALMKLEAEDSAFWARWAAGVDLPDPIPKLSGNLELNFDHFINEANTAKVWCRWSFGTQPGNRGNCEINLQIGEEINFA